MSSTKVRINMIKHGRGEVYINEQKVQASAISLSVGVGKANEITVTLLPELIEVDGVFDVSTIESEAREFKVVNEK